MFGLKKALQSLGFQMINKFFSSMMWTLGWDVQLWTHYTLMGDFRTLFKKKFIMEHC